ncbi:alpha/beta fold hydrolase [Flexivirga caeni]|uniref:Alpha/beta fold hydrolase n=1 Tax=Flexivirga caeni TaxID=2294115 RepID=A0A3M9M1N1_9MICO|nr:alpha/beta fold hydrolase [Flexivirga caeni]RNI19471.1 alpha/beta fold hydrolase [Flexivirga caeni]
MPISTAQCGDVELAYETFGDPANPAVVLVMGLATQMIGWPDGFCSLLVDAGFHVVRFDNRDIGLSTHLHEAGVPDLSGLLVGKPLESAPYTLGDMADDTLGLLDALELERVHLVGASMGGMIVQEFALRHPERLLSLTSIMSTPSVAIGPPTADAMSALFIPPPDCAEAAAARSVAVYRVIGSPGYPLDEAGLAERGKESFRRSNDPAGVARQLAAIQLAADRSERLRGLAVPTLVLHGESDPLVQPDGGRATAAAVPGARRVTFPGMGHDLPEALWPQFVAEIRALATAAARG